VSDTPLAADWWQAADGRWYPPPSPAPPTYAAPMAYPAPATGAAPYPLPAAGPTTNSSAIVALVLGILGLTTCYFVTGIPAIIYGRKGQREVDDSNGAQAGRSMATVGLVLGIISTAISAALLVGVIALLAIGATVDQDDADPTPVTVSVPR
jgi:hypothetical protein